MKKIFLIIIPAVALLAGWYIIHNNTIGSKPSFQSNLVENNKLKTFTNTRYGYSISYPADLGGEISLCGGMGQDYVDPAEVCNEVIFPLTPRYSSLYESLEALILDNNENLSADVYLQKVLADAKITDSILKKAYGNREGVTTVFTGGLNETPDPTNPSGTAHEGKTKIILIPLPDKKILRIIYPLEFCYEIRGQSHVSVPCYSDEKNNIYQQMANSLHVK